jgi:D-alanine-D-alanine ligase
VAVLNGQALPAIRIVPARAFYDYEAKYLRDDTQYHIPCGLDTAVEAKMQAMALKAFDMLGCRGWGRVDFLLDAEAAPHVLEVNTVPGMTDHSLVPMAAKEAGLDFDQLVWQILAGTLEQDHA